MKRVPKVKVGRNKAVPGTAVRESAGILSLRGEAIVIRRAYKSDDAGWPPLKLRRCLPPNPPLLRCIGYSAPAPMRSRPCVTAIPSPTGWVVVQPNCGLAPRR